MAGVVFLYTLSQGKNESLISGTPLKGPDDAMRLAQVVDLLEGAGWYDLNQRRVNPPMGLDMHWSRLPDLPLAAAMLVGEHYWDRDEAVLAAAKLVPPFLGVCFFLAFVWAASPIAGRRGMLYAGSIGAALWVPFLQFSSGRVDHHGWQLLLATLATGGVIRLVLVDKPPLSPAVVAGAAGALGLWVGGEAVPWVGLATGALLLRWIRDGRPAGTSIAIFGATLAAGSTLLLPLAVPRSNWLVPACDAFSIVSLGIAAVIAVFGAVVAMVDVLGGLDGWRRRLVVTAFLGIFALGALYLLFPECSRGPFSQVSPEVSFWIEHIQESQPLTGTLAASPDVGASVLVLPALALALSLWKAVTTAGKWQTLWLCLALLIAGGMLLQFWQIRGTYLDNVYAAFPYVWLAAEFGKKAGRASLFLTRVLLRAAPVALVAAMPVVAVLLAVAVTGQELKPETKPRCDPRPAVQALERLDTGGKPLLIAAPINLGPSLLLLTPDQVLAAPYHRNTEGLRDIRRLLYSDESSAREVVRRRGVDVILVCPNDRLAELARNEGTTPFSDRLLSGEGVPSWLRPVPLEGVARLYQVLSGGHEQ